MEAESLAVDVAGALDGLAVPFMLVGAAALAIQGVTRGSHDIDFMTVETRVLSEDWTTLLPGATIEVLRGDFGDPLIGTVRISRGEATPVDIVVAKWKWQRDAIERAHLTDVGSFSARVPLVDDLVLLKLDAGSFLDERDAAHLIEVHGVDVISRVNERIEALPRHLAGAWERFRRDLAARSEE